MALSGTIGALHGAQAQADTPIASRRLPLWELGLGVAGLRLPDYRGADQSRNYLLPLPYLVYRGDWLRADREGARAVLLDVQRVEVDLSVGAAAPARNNNAREGMPELASRVEFGPSLNLELWRLPERHAKLELRAPLRAAITLQRSPRSVGVSFTPHLNLDAREFALGWDLAVQAGPVFGDRRLHEYLYGVAPVYATPQRPAYAAHAGYAGWQALAAVSRRHGRAWIGAFVRHDSLRDATIADSPLVKSEHSLMLGIGVAWIFSVSDQLVAARE
jgi:outer membrane scaffolding protein for murein synthesis (MipA/OmpV family)